MSFVLCNYKFLNFVGEGSTSKIYDCVSLTDETRTVSFVNKIKQLKLDKNKHYAARVIKTEDLWHVDETILNLNHPNLLKCNDVFQFEDHLFYICDLYDTDLKKISLGKFQLKDKLYWMIDIANALEYLHSCNIYHGDVKPENILLDFKKNQAVLCDYSMSNFFCLNRTYKNTFPFITPFELYNQRFLKGSQEDQLFQLLCKHNVNIEDYITFDRTFMLENGTKSDMFAFGLTLAAILCNMYSIFDLGMEYNCTLEEAIQLRILNYFEFIKDRELYLSIIFKDGVHTEVLELILGLTEIDPQKRLDSAKTLKRFISL